MLNKEKLASIKDKAKQYLPLATTAAGLITTAFAIFVINDAKEKTAYAISVIDSLDEDTLYVTADDREAMKRGHSVMHYTIDGT